MQAVLYVSSCLGGVCYTEAVNLGVISGGVNTLISPYGGVWWVDRHVYGIT